MRAALLAMLAALGGCSVLSPVPSWELVKAAGSAAGVAVSSGGAKASGTVYHLHAQVSEVCIELNPDAPMADLLPALQQELRQHLVSSRVYMPGVAPGDCAHWVRYVAYVDWDLPPLDSQQRMYLRHATLTLHRSDGRLLSHSQYDAGNGYWTGKWASTREKLAPVVSAMLTGFEL